VTRETCSAVPRLYMPGEIKSLNVSNAGGAGTLYRRQQARRVGWSGAKQRPLARYDGAGIRQLIWRSVIAAQHMGPAVTAIAIPPQRRFCRSDTARSCRGRYRSGPG